MQIITETDLFTGSRIAVYKQPGNLRIEIPIAGSTPTPDEKESLEKRVIQEFVHQIRTDAMAELNNSLKYWQHDRQKCYNLKTRRQNLEAYIIDQRLNYSDLLFNVHLHFISAAMVSNCKLQRFHDNMNELIRIINRDCDNMKLPIN